MDLRSLANKAKELVDKRGGTGALKEDAEELKRVAQSRGSLTDKAKEAAEALKDPGAGEPAPEERPTEAPASPGEGKRRGGGGRGVGKDRDRL